MKLEFSKIIASVVISLNIISYFITMYVYIALNKDATKIHEYVNYLCILVISTYALKSGTENVVKINKNNSYENVQDNNKNIEIGDI
jgi:hypothetical protein